MGEQRKIETAGAPQRRYEDAKEASSRAADRIGQATESLLGAFRQAYEPEYTRPRETPAKLLHNQSAE